MNQKFESVQSLRGIAALFVVMQHICFIQRGSFGVDLFFLVSGFIMMYVTEKSTKHFVMKRLIRIVPLYYAMTFVSYLALLVAPGLFEQTTASPVYLIKSLLFIPFSMQGVSQPLLRVGWTVNYEMLFYLLFFISMKISMRYRAVICSVLLVGLVVVGCFIPGEMEPFAFWTDSIILEFAVGMGMFYVLRAMFERVKRIRAVVYAVLLLCVLLVGYMWWSYGNATVSAYVQILRWGIPAVMILCAVFYAGCVLRIPKWLVRLGDMSFSVYLIHYYPMRVLNKLIHHTQTPGVKEIALTLVTVAATLVAAWICYWLIEVKFTNFIRKQFSIGI